MLATPDTLRTGATHGDRLPDLITRITTQTFGQVRNLCVDQAENRVRITGTSSSYYVKQLATHAVLTAAPEAELRNEIRVQTY